MFIRNWKKEILTIPNLLSLLRLGLIPVYISVYLKATQTLQYLAAGLIIAASCLTDAVDGQIARHFNMISNLGKILDPLADKLTQFALTLCLSLRYPILQPVLALFLVKELFQAWLCILHLRRGKVLPGALMAGKLCTTVLFVTLTMLVLLPKMPSRLVTVFALLDVFFLTISFVSYLLAYFGKTPVVQDLDAP